MGVLGNFFSYISQALGMANKASPHIPKADSPTSSGPDTMMNLKRPQEQESFALVLKEANATLSLLYKEFDEYKDAMVHQVLWYKSTETVQHEFVIIKGIVTVMENGKAKKKNIYFKVDRAAKIAVKDIAALKPSQAFPEEALNHPDWSKKDWKEFKRQLRNEQLPRLGGLEALFYFAGRTSNASQTSIDQSRSSSPSSPAYTTAAVDSITRLPDNVVPFKYTFSPKKLATLSFHGKLPYFRDIILAGSVISAADPVHNIMMPHCYWFAQAFIYVLQAKYQGSCSLDKHRAFDRKAGKLRLIKERISVLSPQTHSIPNEVPGLSKGLEDNVEACDEAERLRAAEEQLRAAEEQLRAAEEQLRAAEEQLCAAEARSIAAEARSIAAEARSIAAEATRIAAEEPERAARIAAEERELAARIAAEERAAALQQQIAVLLPEPYRLF